MKRNEKKTTKKAGKKSNNCQELGHITALVDACQWGRFVASRSLVPECGQLLLQLLLPHLLAPRSPYPLLLLHLCVCCSAIACPCPVPAVCVFRMFHAGLNALLFDQLSNCPTVLRLDSLIVQLSGCPTACLTVGLIECPAKPTEPSLAWSGLAWSGLVWPGLV